jgi:AraC-like DNA-binding protein
VKEAALQAGFSDPAYFSRVFRRVYGVPPARWQSGNVRLPAVPTRESPGEA